MVTTSLVATPLVTPAVAAGASSVTEFQPTLTPSRWGGRTHSIDIDPGDRNTAIAGTESGGLFKTTDGGTSWRHIDTLLPFRIADARYAPGDRRIVIATVYNDAGRKVNGNGIFRSTDGGETWSKPATANPPCSARAAAWGISFRPASQQVVVGTDCGFAVSNDRGATWTHVASDRIVGLAATQDGNVYSCGNSGFRRSTLDAAAALTVGAASTLNSTTGTFLDNCFTVSGVATGTHTVGVSPIESNVVFVSAGPNRAYESDDNGATWTSLLPGTTGARSPYVAVNRANADPTQITVYIGGGNSTTRQTCGTAAPATRCTPGAFSAVTADHADQMAIAFTPETTGASRYCALFMADDGGTERSTDCGATFHIAGGSGAGGYNGLQIYEITGQIHPDHTDLYLGTQDNSSWGSGDNGATWTGSVCCEGWHFQIPRYSATHVGQRITYETCGACVNVSSGAHLTGGSAAWNNPPGFVSRPFLLEPGVYVQMGSSGGTQQLYLTTDSGATWLPVPGATLTQGIPNRGELIVAGPPGDPTIYVPVQRAGGTGLVRILGARTAAATVTNADAGLIDIDTGACNGLARFVCPRTVGVDPNDPNHLLVADRGLDRVLQSVNGGNSWTVDTQLTNLVTAGGTFDFDGALSAVGFDPNPVASGKILVGTDAAGILASTDGGANWTKLLGSEVVTAVTSFWFDEVRDNILVSSYGRGLWKLSFPQTDMRVSLSHRPDPAVAGQELYWDVTVTNDGPVPADSVTVTSQLPRAAPYVTDTLAAPAGCTAAPPDAAGQRVSCSLGGMASGESRTYTIKTAVRPDAVSAAGAPTSIEHRVDVRAQGGTDPNPANNSAVDTVVVEDLADLEVTKLCKPDTAPRAGEPIECTVFVDNHGPSDARSVVVDDTMLGSQPFTVTDVSPSLSSGTPGCTRTTVPGGQRLTCRLGIVAAATTTQPGRATITYRITSAEGQDLNNTASVRSDTPDPDPANDRATLALTIRSVAEMGLTMTGPSSVVAGTGITWSVTATNNGGPSTAQDVEITDTVPAGVTITSVSAPGGTCTAGAPGDSTRPTACAFGSVVPGASRTMTITATVLPSTTGILNNDARVSTSTLDDDTGNDLAHVATAVATEAALEVTHTDTPDPVVAGRGLDYVTRVTNSGGPSTARNIRLTDTLPADVVFLSADVANGDGTCTQVLGSPNQVRCELGTLQPGEYRVVTLHTMVKPSAEEGSSLASGVVATSSTSAPGGGANSVAAGVSTLVDRVSDIVTVKTSDADVYKPSATIQYTVSVTNLGPSDAHPVTVVDNLPPKADAPYVSDSGNGACTFNAGTNSLTCAFGPIAAGATRSVNVYVRVKGNKGTITNVATASTTTDDNNSNNTSIRQVLVKGGV